MAQWIAVARLEELSPGMGRMVEVEGARIGIFLAGDEVYAIDNACPHLKGSLGKGRLDGMEVACPLHRWKFHVGTGACSSRPGHRVRTYEVKVEDGQVAIRVG